MDDQLKKKILNKMRTIYKKSWLDAFTLKSNGGSYNGNAWKAIKQSTIDRKKRKGSPFPSAILKDTLKLYSSLKVKANYGDGTLTATAKREALNHINAVRPVFVELDEKDLNELRSEIEKIETKALKDAIKKAYLKK